MFGEGLLTGMGVTWKHFWGKKETFCYPEEKLPMTERFRGGHLVLDHTKCIACSVCSLACPMKKRHMQSYVHLVGRCLYCNLCVEACNTHALAWDKNYAISSWHPEDMDDELVTDEGRAYFEMVMEKAKAEAEAEAKAAAEKAEAEKTGGDA